MKVEQLQMQCFRGIRELTMSFHPRLTVLVGVNGSGKSTILDALGMLLSRFSDKVRSASKPSLRLSDEDITNGEASTTCRIAMNVGDQRAVSWTIARVREGHKADAASEHRALDALVSEVQQAITDGAPQGIPVLAHYPVHRAVLHIRHGLQMKHRSQAPLDALDDWVHGHEDSFRQLFEWVRFREDVENEQRRDGVTTPDRQLEAVRRALPRFLDGFSDLRVRRAPMRMTISKGGEVLELNQLSGGEKCLLAMVGDIARRLAMANPTLEDPLSGAGIVLIDEIELHLHPGWQRRIIGALQETFPGCQFIVTTQSPEVIGQVRPESVRELVRQGRQVRVVEPAEAEGAAA